MRMVAGAVAVIMVGCVKTEARRDPPADASVSALVETTPAHPDVDAAVEPEPTPPASVAIDSGPPWLRKLKEPGRWPAVAFSCNRIALQRAWRYHGEAATEPSNVEELAAFHVRSSVSDGYTARLVADDGRELDTELVFVRADAKGRPLDRFYETNSAPYGPVDIVGIAAVPKGTRTVTFRARNSLSVNQLCDTPVTLGEAPAWPPMPRYEVVRLYRTKRKSLMILYRAKNVLPLESSAPTLTWKPAQPTHRDGIAVQEIRTGLKKAIVSTNAEGEPALFDPNASSHWVVAEYEWTGDETPNQYTAGDRMADLPVPTAWTVSPKLAAALNESAAVRYALGDDGGNAFFSGGREGVIRALAANQIIPW
jgi:hypothetical protein